MNGMAAHEQRVRAETAIRKLDALQKRTLAHSNLFVLSEIAKALNVLVLLKLPTPPPKVERGA